MICVECGRPVNDVYKEYGVGNIRLTRCQYCNRFADKYVEHEMVIIILDLLLLRPQVYRHLLFNRMHYLESGIDVRYIKILTVFLFFESYIKWFGMRAVVPNPSVLQYLALCVVSCFEISAFIIPIALAVRAHVSHSYAIVKYNYLIMAIILSSFAKPFLLLMMVWPYALPLNTMINVFIFCSNVVALKVFLACSTWKAAAVVGVGAACRLVVSLSLSSQAGAIARLV